MICELEQFYLSKNQLAIGIENREYVHNFQIIYLLYTLYFFLTIYSFKNDQNHFSFKYIKYFREIAKPTSDEWGTGMDAIEASLQLERDVNESLLTLHKAADTKVIEFDEMLVAFSFYFNIFPH